MKKTLFLALAALCLATVHAAALPQPPVLQDAKGRVSQNYAPNLDFIGADIYYVEASTPTDTPVLLGAGAGTLYGVEHTSGTAGDFCMFFDASSASGILTSTKGKALTPAVLTSANNSTACTDPNVCGSWAPKYPRRFTAGLVGIKRGTSNSNCLAAARFDADNSAAPLVR